MDEEFTQKHYKPQPVRADYRDKRQRTVNNDKTPTQARNQAYLQGTALANAGGRNKRASRI